MKRTQILSLLLLVITIPVVAQQQFPNAGMENWTTRSNSWEEPANWYSLNMLKQFSYPASVIKTTDAHSGQYAAKLETQSSSTDIPGLLCSAYMFDQNFGPDFNLNFVPFSSRPFSCSFWYKCSLMTGSDSIVFLMTLTRWNASTQTKDTIGMATWFAPQSQLNYTQATVPFTYFSSLSPDSASWIFVTTVFPFAPVVGNILYLDDLSLSYTNSVEPSPSRSSVSVYPNPVSDLLHIHSEEEVMEARLFDLSGKAWTTLDARSKEFDLDCNLLKPGMYFLRIRKRSGEMETIRIIK